MSQSVESAVPQVNTLRLARVAETYPQAHLVDVVFLDDGGFAGGVPILSQTASQDHGFSYLPMVDLPEGGKWDVRLSDKNDMLCAVAWASQQPVVIGFLFPLGGKMGVPKNELMDKHASGSYRQITGNGDMLLRHMRGWRVHLIEDGVLIEVDGARILVERSGKIYLN